VTQRVLPKKRKYDGADVQQTRQEMADQQEVAEMTASKSTNEATVLKETIITIYAPVFYTAPCVKCLMRASALRGVGPGS
jgi:hypothetical protein